MGGVYVLQYRAFWIILCGPAFISFKLPPAEKVKIPSVDFVGSSIFSGQFRIFNAYI